MPAQPSFVILGAGNTGTRLGKALYTNGFIIKQVISRTLSSARELAGHLEAEYSTEVRDLDEADIYLIAIRDDAVEEVAASLPPDIFAVHTSGNLPLAALSRFTRYGVLYPVQSLSKAVDISLVNVPFCVEGSDHEVLETLTGVAKSLSANVVRMDSDKRRIVHLAAVFANNFTHYLLTASASILEKENLSFDLLKPLIEETLRKALNADEALLKTLQTGPAKRGDFKTMASHLEILKKHAPEYEELYSLLSRSINSKR